MAGFEEYPPKKPYRYDPHEIWNENYRFNNPKGDNNSSQQLEAVTLTDDQSPPPEGKLISHLHLPNLYRDYWDVSWHTYGG